MAKQDIEQYSLAELEKLNAEGKYRKTPAGAPAGPELDADFWDTAEIIFPAIEGKQPVKLRIDRDVLAFFKSQGKGYQTRINAVLKSYVESQKKKLRGKGRDTSDRA